MELFAYLRIRGPLGPPRWDYDLAQSSMYAGAPYPEGTSVSLEDFQPPWHTELDDEEVMTHG